MNGQGITGATKQLHSLMDAASTGLSKFQDSPPGTKKRSNKELKNMYDKIMNMTEQEKNVKLAEIAGIVGEENLVRFLLKMSREK